jgi:tol-pal system protein YbgF
LAALFSLATGCVSGSDIEGLHRHVGDVEKKVDALAKQSSSKEEVAKLNESLSRQSGVLLRSNADLGAKFDDLTRELQTLAGKLEDANRRLTQLSQQIAETQSRIGGGAPSSASPPAPVTAPAGSAEPRLVPAPPVPGPGTAPAASKGPSPADTFSQATADYQRGQFELARQGFQEYAETWPKTDVSDDALYWVGECWLAQKKPREAITAFDRLFKLYPDSDKGATAHLKKGLAHLDLGEKAQAIVQLQYVVHQYPGSDEAKSARQRLKTLGSDSR